MGCGREGQRVRYDIDPTYRWAKEFRVRTARRSHACRGRHLWDGRPLPIDHTPTIKKGEQYAEGPDEVRYGAGPRFCAACSLAIGVLMQVRA